MTRSLIALTLALSWTLSACDSKTTEPKTPKDNGALSESEIEASMKKSCVRCHQFPPPDILPKSLWPYTIDKMYDYIGMKGKKLDGLTAEQVTAWYQKRAPETIPMRKVPESRNSKIGFKKHDFTPPKAPDIPAISSVRFVRRHDSPELNVMVTDMKQSFTLLCKVREQRFSVLSRSPHPCRTEIADINGDQRPDLITANLGSFNPGDHDKGSVTVKLAGQKHSWPLVEKVGRVTDVKLADFDGDGDTDAVVGVFGWHSTGQVLWLENRTKDWSKPEFIKHSIDSRHGVIATPVMDVNGDGRMDIVALFSQEHESLVAFLNLKDGFKAKTLDKAPHPAWGSNALQLVDMDGDGDLDALISNGDTLDDMVLRLSHGIRWIENDGKDWKAHTVSPMYAVHSARAVDFDKDGDMDVVACAFLPQFNAEDLAGSGLPSIVWFEQTDKGVFEEWVIERMKACHPCLDVGDYDADGDLDLVVGCFTMAVDKNDRLKQWFEIWENLGPRKN